MTSPVKSYAYPEVHGPLNLSALPARRWVECASCIEMEHVESDEQADKWATEHHRVSPRHDRFRVVVQTGWRIPPADDVTTP
ncbi:hypothetical protein [Streptomyces colonosanans]|uniref:DUF7848 domain-containing protein n=1 Tax=Streptomyces colonosanans TaxID=1428652 RepID=A0A1S2Q4J7_9ACTN|nr:hypothetical protein [Streptomyces colonosanans]OIK00115.1 hypothetical protein BIV24_03605 [Streptomyces colonosanans]